LIREIIILLILIILVNFPSCNNTSSDIFQEFYLLNSDSISVSDVKNQREWKQLKSLRFIPLRSHKNKMNEAYGWLKIPFTINNAEKFTALFLKGKLLSDTVYINGKPVGSKKKKNFSPLEYLKPSLYQLPPDIIKTGYNEMLIRITTPDFVKGSIQSIELLRKKQYESKLFWNNFFNEQLFFIIIVMCFSLIILQGTMYIVDRKIKIRLINALFILYNMSIFLLFLTTDNLFSGNNQLWLNFIFTYIFLSAPLLIIFIIILLQSLYKIYLSQLNRIFIPLSICAALAIIFSNGNIMMQIILNAFILLFGFLGLAYMVYLLNRIKPNPFLLRIIIIELTIIVFSGLWSTLSVPLELPVQCPDNLTWNLSLFYIFIAILYEAVLAKRQRKKINRLYEELKNGNKEKPQKSIPLLSQSSEAKLETVIEFIKKNYTSDLSREGLAAAANMNVNYFSTLFNSYTGKKINEYINSLRIKDAVEYLENTDDKIIEIAFNVGFDSLTTFNRAFKNETGSIPSKFRKDIKENR